MRGGKGRPKNGFHFIVQKQFMPDSSGTSLAKMSHLDTKNESSVWQKVICVVYLPVPLTPGGRGARGDGIPDAL